MSDLKSYTCAECGAVLSVDKLQGQFVCPFCGAEFNSVYFHRDELIKQADECLSRGAYEAAQEKYDAVLANNKGDLDAIRGSLFVAGKIHSMKDLNNSENLLRGDIEAIKGIENSCKDSLNEEDAGYIKKLAGLFDKASDIKFQKEKIKTTLEKEREIRNEMRKHVQPSGGVVAGCGTVYGLLIVMLLGAGFMNSEMGVGVGILIFIIGLIAVGLVANLSDKGRVDVLEYDALAENSTVLKEKLSEMEEAYNADLNFVLRYGRAIRTGAKRLEKKEIKIPAGTDAGEVICAKCGGALALNADKELYECSYCGVSYGTVMFLGDLLQNAKKAIGYDGFDDADQILAHKLRLNPGDSDALLGRFLCAGKYKSLSEIRFTDKAFFFHVAKLTERIDKLEHSISVDVQHAWPELRRLFDLMSEYAGIRKEADKTNEKCNSIAGKIKDPTRTKYEIYKYQKEYSRIKTASLTLDDERVEKFREATAQLDLIRKIFKDSAFA